MGRQYVRHSFSSAPCAAGDSPCASSTIVQCVVANTAGLQTISPVVLREVKECSGGSILPCKQGTRSKARLRGTGAILVVTAQTDSRAVQFLWRMLSLR